MTIRYVADLCSNHNGDLDRLIDLIEVAKGIGCSAVKLQMYDERLGRTPEEKKKFGETKMPKDFVSWAYHKCKELGLELHCTPFHPDFVKFLDPYVDEFKIGSYELLWLELIRACAKTGKPINISCGGGTTGEINRAFHTAIRFLPAELISLYHCIPHYPAKPNQAQLYKITELKQNYPNSIIGYSDHINHFYIMLDAVRFKAQAIEFHLDLEDGKGNESHLGHCWNPAKAQDMIIMSSSIEAINNGQDSFYYADMRKKRTNPNDGMRGIQE